MGELALPIRSPPNRVFVGRAWSDERLARAVAKGDTRAFTLLYQRHHQALYRYCRLILRDEHDAQDALQSAMARAFAALRGRERDLAVRPWLFRIAHNEAVSLLRRRRPTTSLTETLEPADLGVEQTLQQRERFTLLVADLQELSERQRAALVMRELSGLSIEEIAGALATSPGAAKQVLFEARGALHDFAEGRAMECEQIRRAISDEDRRALRARRLRAHLRGCPGCCDFQAALATRRADLHALAPGLAPVAATALLGRLLAGGATSGHAGGLAVGAGGLAGGATSGHAGGLAVGAGGLAGGSSGAAGGSVVGSIALKVAIGAAVAATAAGGARLALVHGRSGHARSAVRSAAPASPGRAPATPAGSSGGAPHRSHPAGGRGGQTLAASRGGATASRASRVVTSGGSSGLGAFTSAGASGGARQVLRGSAAQPGRGKSDTRAVRGAANGTSSHGSSNSRRPGSTTHRPASSRATHTTAGRPSTRPSRRAGSSANGRAGTETAPASSRHPVPPATPTTSAGAPVQPHPGQPNGAPAGSEAEAHGAAGSGGRS